MKDYLDQELLPTHTLHVFDKCVDLLTEAVAGSIGKGVQYKELLEMVNRPELYEYFATDKYGEVHHTSVKWFLKVMGESNKPVFSAKAIVPLFTQEYATNLAVMTRQVQVLKGIIKYIIGNAKGRTSKSIPEYVRMVKSVVNNYLPNSGWERFLEIFPMGLLATTNGGAGQGYLITIQVVYRCFIISFVDYL